jgi:outer membrane lipoprotein-sorting protein
MTLMAVVMSLQAMAQDAKTVLDKAAAAVSKSAGLEVVFSFEAFKQGQSLGTSAGTMQLKGNKFRLQTTEGATTWFNGTTQWTYQKQNEEVTITTPTTQELESINPYKVLSSYKSGYSYKLLSANSYNGLSVYTVELTATDKKKNFSRVTLYLSRSNYLPVFIRVVLRDNTRNDIKIKSCKTGTSLTDQTFTFNKRSYPKAEIIDLR